MKISRLKQWVSALILEANRPEQLTEILDGLDKMLTADQVAARSIALSG